MNYLKQTLRTALAGAACLTLTAAAAGAQAFEYPSFQQPRVTEREFNFALNDGDSFDATSLLFQWREGYGANGQLSLDVGFADTDPDGTFFIGGQFGHQLLRSGADTPIDLMLTAGVNGAFGNNASLFRIPIGVSIGRRFPLEGGLAITPYVHPRVSIDHFNIDLPGDDFSDTEMNLNFDLGGSFEFNSQLALRLSAALGEDEAIGLSVAYTPRGLQRR